MAPRIGDHVYVASRVRYNRNPHGWVIAINRSRNSESEPEVVVKFADSLWVGANNMDLHDPEFCLEGGDTDTLSFEEFEDGKVSSELPEGTFRDYRDGRERYEGAVDDGEAE